MGTNFETGNVISARFEYYNGESRCFNMAHWRLTNVLVTATGLPPAVTIPFVSVAGDFAADLYAMWSTPWASLASIQWSMTGVTVQNIHPAPRSLPVSYVPSGALSGEVVDDALPAQDTATILRKTDFGERWGMGRIFIPGLAENQQNNGVINPAGTGGLTTLANTIQAFASGTVGPYTYQVEPVLFGKADGGPRINPIRQHVLSDNVLKTQRRRRPGKGI